MIFKWNVYFFILSKSLKHISLLLKIVFNIKIKIIETHSIGIFTLIYLNIFHIG